MCVGGGLWYFIIGAPEGMQEAFADSRCVTCVCVWGGGVGVGVLGMVARVLSGLHTGLYVLFSVHMSAGCWRAYTARRTIRRQMLPRSQAAPFDSPS
jgi:hypothetical protein